MRNAIDLDAVPDVESDTCAFIYQSVAKAELTGKNTFLVRACDDAWRDYFREHEGLELSPRCFLGGISPLRPHARLLPILQPRCK